MVHPVRVDQTGPGPVGAQLRRHVFVHAVDVRVGVVDVVSGGALIGDPGVEAAVIGRPDIQRFQLPVALRGFAVVEGWNN